jgi:NADH-quinone oxidoreductase subunit L
MFRMWYMTFAGEPRNQDRYDHAHESPAVMTAPLVVLAVLAVAVAWNPSQAIIGAVIAVVVLAVLAVAVAWNLSQAIIGAGIAVVVLAVLAVAVAWNLSQAVIGEVIAVIAVIGAIVLAVRAGSSSDESSHTDHAHGHDGHDTHGDDGHGQDTYSEPMSTGKAVLIIGGVLVVLIGIWSQIPVTLEGILEQNRPAGTLASAQGVVMDVVVPDEHLGHAYAIFIGPLATFTAIMGFALATFMYGVKYLDPEEVRNRFSRIYKFLRNKWYFDELYDVVFVKTSIRIGKFISEIDKRIIDGFVHWIAAATKWISRRWDQIADHMIVDGSINWVAKTTRRIGVSLKVVQTGSLRQYVMFIVVGTIALFVLLSFFWSPTFAK